MKMRIRTKLILGMSILMIILFSVTAYLFITEKKRELADDIYSNMMSFSRLTAPSIAQYYDLYLDENSFVYFNREIQSIFDQNDDLGQISVISYTGDILYDSSVDLDKRYELDDRIVEDIFLKEQIRSENLSLKTNLGNVFYFKRCKDQETLCSVDENEKSIEPPLAGTLVDYVVLPGSEKYAVVYHVDYMNFDERVSAMVQRILYLAAFGILLGIFFAILVSWNFTWPIRKLVKGAEKIAEGDFDVTIKINTGDEIAYLASAFNRMASDLKSTVAARMYRERVGRELELARQIQEELIPKSIPHVEGIEISAALLPAEEIGGDMYDFLPSYPGHFLFYLGDVTGHGVPAGLISSISSALFYGFANLEDLKKITVDVNRVLKAKTLPNMFMTLCLMDWENQVGKFSFVNAGHEQLIYCNKRNNSVALTSGGGMALGMVSDVSPFLKLETIELKQGDFVVIYSDGIPEAWRNQSETYGMQRFLDVVRKNIEAKTAVDMKNAIIEDVKRFREDYKQMDDITLIVIRKS